MAGKDRQQTGLGFGQLHVRALAAQLRPAKIETEGAEGHFCDLGRRRLGRRAAQHAANARNQFARLERLGQIVVGPQFQPGDAIFRFAHGGQHQDRDRAGAAQGDSQFHAALARHHDVENQQVEGDMAQMGARFRGVGCGRHAKAVLAQELAQQLAEPVVVVHHQNMRLVFLHGATISPVGARS